MLIKSSKGLYKVERNYRNAFNLETFQEKYIEECFDKYQYIFGDYSSNILRLKGFDTNPSSSSYYKNIDKFIDDSCAFGCPYFVLSRIHSEKEYQELEAKDSDPITEDARFKITNIQKENFDKESLVLKVTPKDKANIVIDSSKLNNIPKGSLPPDLAEIAKTEKNQSNQRKTVVEKKEPEQTFVSSSPDFDPSKKEKRNNKFNRYNNNRKK